MERKVKKILGKQLELLAERSKDSLEAKELAALTSAMCEIANLLAEK